MIKFSLILLALLPVYGYSQENGNYPVIGQSDFPDAIFGPPKTYSGSSLFGYIDGGAELYLEYGFSGAWVNEMIYKKGRFVIEIYRMNGPEEAFGIFSVSRFRCSSSPPLSHYTCQNPYQLQICAGIFYISIINESANQRDSMSSVKIGEAIVRKIKEGSVNFTSWMPDVPAETLNQKAILVKGNTGIMNGAPEMAEIFDEVKEYTALIFQNEKMTSISARFETHEEAVKFSKGKEVVWLSENHVLIHIAKTS